MDVLLDRPDVVQMKRTLVSAQHGRLQGGAGKARLIRRNYTAKSTAAAAAAAGKPIVGRCASHPLQYISFDRTMQDIVYKLVPNLMEG
ncbi:hypothetical protein RP20_CCG011752 [Aedes albopictus]|nr:hypothetical protein RP20_CCG011752 [Aedes albopictus]